MFSFLKSKPLLKEILPNDYIDIHNHILPGIDDGAASIEDTDTLIAGMKELGISNAIVTPHTFFGRWDNTTHDIHTAFEKQSKEAIDNTYIIRSASEYMLDPRLIAGAKTEPLLCIKDNYLLVELHLFTCPMDLYELLFELKIKGYKIVIAHPERYVYFHNNIQKFEKLKDFGVDFQMNLLSLTGYYSKSILQCTQQLLDYNFYDFTGTDIHHVQHIERLKNKPLEYFNKNKLIDLLEKNNQLL
jgi:tyrosine-protein phosphatase YwqE